MSGRRKALGYSIMLSVIREHDRWNLTGACCGQQRHTSSSINRKPIELPPCDVRMIAHDT
jgi:hypothetical protein